MSAPVFPVLILAGGLATRLKPLTEKIPKSLLDVNGEPFIAHQLRLLHAHGVTRVVICAGFLGEQIREAVGDGARYGVEADYAFDYPKLLGTAGAIKQALPLVAGPFFVLYGDSYLPCDYRAVQAAYTASGQPALMTVYRNHGRWDRSNVEFAEGRIQVYDKMRTTPRMDCIDYGLGVFAPRVFAAVLADQPTDLAGVYQQLLARGELAGYEVTQRFYHIGSFAALEETRQYLQTTDRRPQTEDCKI